jgi:hypothetical protein
MDYFTFLKLPYRTRKIFMDIAKEYYNTIHSKLDK